MYRCLHSVNLHSLIMDDMRRKEPNCVVLVVVVVRQHVWFTVVDCSNLSQSSPHRLSRIIIVTE